MRVFLTGATGYIGGAVALALRERGHDVAALVRPESESKHLRDAGVVMVAGDMASLPSLGDTLAAYDVLVSMAQSNSDTAELAQTAVDAFTAQKGFLIYTSGVWVLGNGVFDDPELLPKPVERYRDIEDPTFPKPGQPPPALVSQDLDDAIIPKPLEISAWRVPIEQQVIAAGGAVLRPGCVYGGKQALLAQWFAAADQKQPLTIVGNGQNHWAMVNLHDLADCYVRLVEQRVAGVFNAVDDTRATIDECARAVAPDAKLEHVPAEGLLGEALAVDQIVSTERTRQTLGWIPKRTFPGSIDEQWREWRSALQKTE